MYIFMGTPVRVIQNIHTCLQPCERVTVSGKGSQTLLEGQLTCHVAKVPVGTSVPAAQCSPNGKVLSLFQLSGENDTWQLDLPPGMAELTLAALKKYAVFYREVILQTLPAPDLPAIDRLAEIRAGKPAIYPETSGMFFAHELHLDALGAISLDKGCYTGQEIIARMHYRGKSKTGLFHVTLTASAAPSRGADIFSSFSGEKPCGRIVDSVSLAPDQHELLVTALLSCQNFLHLDAGGDLPLTLKRSCP